MFFTEHNTGDETSELVKKSKDEAYARCGYRSPKVISVRVFLGI